MKYNMKRIFAIHYEAGFAVFSAGGALVELVAGLCLLLGYDNLMGYVALGASALMFLMSFISAMSVYLKVKNDSFFFA